MKENLFNQEILRKKDCYSEFWVELVSSLTPGKCQVHINMAMERHMEASLAAVYHTETAVIMLVLSSSL